MRHERIPMAVKLKADADAECQPCEPAGGYVNRLPSLERQSVNHGGHDGDAPGPSSMDWLMHQHDLIGHGPGGHDIMEAHAGGDDPLSSLLHMEQEGQGNNSDFGGFGDDLFSIQPANPSGIFSSSANARRGREGSGEDHTNARGNGTNQGSNSSGNSGTSDCTNNAGFGGEKTSGSGPVGDVGEMETTLTRPFATSALRQAQLQRYRAKRLARHLGHKKIRYECRKTLADNRPRIKGRFAKVLPEGMAAAQSCPDLPSLGKRAQSEEPTKQSSEDSTGGVATTKGRRSRLSGGSDANSGLVKGKGGKGVAVKKEKVRRDSDGSEQIAETNDGLGHLRSSTRGGLPYTQSEVSLAQLDRTGRW
jgi:hypothetical protein